MDVTATHAAARFRSRARLEPARPTAPSTAEVTARADPSLMAARVEELTTLAPPSSTVSQRFVASNSHFDVGEQDPDHCELPATPLSGGAEVQVRALNNGSELGREVQCTAAGGLILERDTRIVLEHPVPSEPGEYTIVYEFSLAGSGQVFETLTATITVDESAPDPPDRNGNGNGLFGDVPLADIALLLGSFALLVLVLALAV